MRLARIISASDLPNAAIDRLVETADLDVLQLDYVWPNAFPADARYAVGLLHQLRTLHKTLYLDPKLHLITNAGGGNPRGCVEALAVFLCEHDDASMPLSAIRGDNVLPQLDELVAEGVELIDYATKTNFCELTHPVLSAQIELGAGPLATAWDEGSRLVVAGCYDLAAPMIAAAVSALQWSWEQLDQLAPLATVAHLPQSLIDIDQNTEQTIQAQPNTDFDAALFRQKILDVADDQGFIRHADIHCQVGDLEFQESSLGRYRVAGVAGLATSGEWWLRLTYQDGYSAEAQFECRDVEAAESAVQMLQSLLNPKDKNCRKVQIDLLSTQGSEAQAMVRVRCCSQDRKLCVEFDNELINFSLQSNLPGCELTGSSPRWQAKHAQFCCPVPRDAITVSVDTRPAKEWR